MVGQIKALTITGVIAVACSIAILMFILTVKEATHRDMQTEIDKIKEIMSCPNNECDRFKGKDAEALEARLMLEIERRCNGNP